MMNCKSTHKPGEVIHENWEYIGEKRPVKCYEPYEVNGHVCIAHDDINIPYEILQERGMDGE